MSTMRRREEPHNTPEQVREYVSAALELVEELEVADDLRVAAFTKAVDLYSSKQLFLEQSPPIGLGAMAIPGLKPAH